MGCDGLAEATDLLVGRVKWDLLDQSYAGLILTSGDPTASGASRTYGGDVRLATSSFLGGSRNLDVNAYAARSVREGITERDWSYGVSARYPNDRYDAQVAFKEVQSNFDPSLGFVQRPGVRMFRIAASFNPRPADFLDIQQMFHDIFYTRFTNLESGEVESWDVHVTPVDWHFSSGDNLHSLLDFRPTYERLFEPFQISPGSRSAHRPVSLHPLSRLRQYGQPTTPLRGRRLRLGKLLVGPRRGSDDLPDVSRPTDTVSGP